MAKDTSKDEKSEVEKSVIFLTLLAVLVSIGALMLAAWQVNETTDQNWVCSQTECAQSVDAQQQWISSNCQQVQNQTLCRTQNGVQPLAQINTTGIRLCTQTVCTQKVNVKNVSENINTTPYFIQE